MQGAAKNHLYKHLVRRALGYNEPKKPNPGHKDIILFRWQAIQKSF